MDWGGVARPPIPAQLRGAPRLRRGVPSHECLTAVALTALALTTHAQAPTPLAAAVGGNMNHVPSSVVFVIIVILTAVGNTGIRVVTSLHRSSLWEISKR